MDTKSQHDYQVLVTPFLQLKNSEGRRRAWVLNPSTQRHNTHVAHRLNGLVDSLTHDQIRELRNAIGGVDLCYDIVAELPLELSQMILQHLPLHQCFQARRVSRKWKKITSSPSTIDCVLQHWYPTTDTGLCIPGGISAGSAAFLKAEHVDAFKTGRPFSMMTHDLHQFHDGVDAEKFAYAEGVIAWIDPIYTYAIKALDLRTRIEGEFLTDNRCIVTHVAMSSSILAGLSPSARCYVWDLSTLDQISLRLPSADFDDLTVSGTTLAIASFRMRITPRVEVVTWDLRNRTTQSFFVSSFSKQPENIDLWQMTIDRQGESVIFFETTYHGDISSLPEQLHFTRTNLKGDVLARGSLGLGCVVDAICHNVASFFDIDGSGTPWVFSGFPQGPRDIRKAQEVFRISFNFDKNRFETGKYKLNESPERIDWTARFFSWKDVMYSSTTITNRRYGVIDLRESCLHSIDMAPRVVLPDSWKDAESSWILEGGGLLLGDEIFLVHVLPSGFYAWCFDKNVRMANENFKFKFAREAGLLRESNH